MITKVLSVGGSIIAPDAPDAKFLSEFSAMVTDWLHSKKDARLILVAGGGGPARTYQNAYRDVAKSFTAQQKNLHHLLMKLQPTTHATGSASWRHGSTHNFLRPCSDRFANRM